MNLNGLRSDIECANLITDSGDEWDEECLYLCVYSVHEDLNATEW